MAHMTKRVRRPSDPTVAASLHGGETIAAPVEAGHTTAVPNTRPTDKVELAWSSPDLLGDDDAAGDDVRAAVPKNAAATQSWGATLRIAGLVVAAGLVLGGAIVVGHWALTSTGSPNKVESPAATSAAGNTTTSFASTEAQDNDYIQTLHDKGFTGYQRQTYIDSGKQVCKSLAANKTVPQVVAEFRDANAQNNPGVANRAAEYVDISIKAYCPQYAG